MPVLSGLVKIFSTVGLVPIVKTCQNRVESEGLRRPRGTMARAEASLLEPCATRQYFAIYLAPVGQTPLDGGVRSRIRVTGVGCVGFPKFRYLKQVRPALVGDIPSSLRRNFTTWLHGF
jgi:hypothetical protein